MPRILRSDQGSPIRSGSSKEWLTRPSVRGKESSENLPTKSPFIHFYAHLCSLLRESYEPGRNRPVSVTSGGKIATLRKNPLPARFTPPRLIFATFSALYGS
ncbi:hypothetical protein HRG_012461 [Hirsutella rhossiliensis]